jgi:hypothetical protein
MSLDRESAGLTRVTGQPLNAYQSVKFGSRAPDLCGVSR